MEELYTLIIDFEDGTYVTQGHSTELIYAAKECIRNLDVSDISDVLKEQDKSLILSQLDEDTFIALEGLHNAWCGQVNLDEKILLLNLVKTAS